MIAPLRPLYAALLLLLLFPGACIAAPALFGFSCPESDVRENPAFIQGYGVYWDRVVGREKEKPSFTPQGERFNNADAAQWRNMVHYSQFSGFHDMLRMVNGYFNQWKPAADSKAWGQDEHWATPAEFVSKRGGDCEDYAIAKYFALRHLKVPPDKMRIVIIRQRKDSGAYEKQLHAVLAVLGPSNNAETWFILDNNARPRDGITLHTQYDRRFIPLLSMNENGAWAHCPDPAK
ncbi:transglutaminase-like cysteine peptidase [Desulfovibrio sp. OttesenSCG-928-I05]|nr:transglutaminase-like cysteine peptidase [Desulfovibrio sp. OttesenSCG-928-I05]